MKLTLELEDVSGDLIPRSEIFQASTDKGVLRISDGFEAGLVIDLWSGPSINRTGTRGRMFLIPRDELVKKFLAAVREK